MPYFMKIWAQSSLTVREVEIYFPTALPIQRKFQGCCLTCFTAKNSVSTPCFFKKTFPWPRWHGLWRPGARPAALDRRRRPVHAGPPRPKLSPAGDDIFFIFNFVVKITNSAGPKDAACYRRRTNNNSTWLHPHTILFVLCIMLSWTEVVPPIEQTERWQLWFVSKVVCVWTCVSICA